MCFETTFDTNIRETGVGVRVGPKTFQKPPFLKQPLLKATTTRRAGNTFLAVVLTAPAVRRAELSHESHAPRFLK